MSAAEPDSSRSRRPRPEGRTIYRPGSGPLKKSCSNVENIQPNPSANVATGRDSGHATTSSKKDATVNGDRGVEPSRSNTNSVDNQPPPSKPKKYSNHRAERETYKPKGSSTNQRPAHADQRSDHAGHDMPQPSPSTSQGAKQKMPPTNRTETELVQDLRQLILDKRSQKGNELPSSSHPEQNNTNLPRTQATRNNETGHQAGESSGPGKHNDRGHSNKRRNERKPNPRVENSQSEGHLSALTTNNSSVPPAHHQPPRAGPSSGKGKSFGPAADESERSKSGRGRREGGNRKKHRNGRGGSRRGSVSSDTVTTPVPAETSRPNSRTGGNFRSRHASSPQQSRSRHESGGGGRSERQSSVDNQPVSPSIFYRPASSATPPPPAQGRRESSEPPTTNYIFYQSAPVYESDQRKPQKSSTAHPQQDYATSRVNGSGRPPSGRGGNQRPSNFDSLPPRLRRKYEEERGHQSLPSQPGTRAEGENDWDGGTLTFVSHKTTGSSSKPPISRGGGNLQSPAYPPDYEDVDSLLIRPRSQEGSMSGGFSMQSRERKTSFNDSRSSTPSSNVDSGVHPFPRGTLRRLEEINGAQTSLDWSEEMEEEDRRSMAEDPKQYGSSGKQQQQPQQRTPPAAPIVFGSSDIRYQNKPIQGYTVLPTSNGTDKIPPAGRPVFGQGRRQEPPAAPRLSVPGLIQLPSGPPPSSQPRHSPRRADGFRDYERGQPTRPSPDHRNGNNNNNDRQYRKPSGAQRTLFDPANPHKPIVVAATREEGPYHPRPDSPLGCPEAYLSIPADHGTGQGKPLWYDPKSDNFRDSKSDPRLLMDIARCDMELAWLIQGPGLLHRFNRIQMNRRFMQDSLRSMLVRDLRFCQNENVEQHIWKTTFHNVIEALRKAMTDEPESKEEYRTLLFTVIDEGSAYFESLLDTLQQAYSFVLDTYLEPQAFHSLSGLRYVGLAVISSQKILIFLGDLARYREMTAETNNYGKAKSWYTKANLANPKNGRPYNQLAILALYARRKLDAVYLYMRSLMASNPFLSARESLVSLFDENRKKYEQQERKRREAKEASRILRNKEPSSSATEAGLVDHKRGLRREIWIHPQDGRRTRRTTSTGGSADSANAYNSDDEELAQLPSIEVNKRFVTSYLNVQGKLYTKIGMETFQECGLQMLREFRALLQQTPLPVNQTRLLQLLALNMFAVSNTQLKDTRMAGGCRSAWQECALIVSLEMFNILLERCNAMLKEQLDGASGTVVPSCRLLGEDLQIILPAVKVWCDWLLCHSSVWNPPPTSRDYHVGPPGTPWTRLAVLFNLLSRLNMRQVEITSQAREGYEAVKLPEDIALCGFTPLMVNVQEPHYAPKSSDMDLAADCVRIERMLYFGRDFLCGLDPPVLKLKFIGPSLSEYVCVVDGSGSGGGTSGHHHARGPGPVQDHKDDIRANDDEDADDDDALLEALDHDLEILDGEDEEDAGLRQLRQRKDELTQQHLNQERRKQQLKAILRERVQLELEVRPKYLVADTNCYIDHLPGLVQLLEKKHYTLIAPLVVLNELDGLCRSRLGAEARAALSFLRADQKNPQIRYVTSKGAPLPAMACTMNEENDNQGLTNDDRILQCCLSFIKDKAGDEEQHEQDGVKRLRREVVLLTEDRNLRVKALARDVPVRDLPAFLTWSSASSAAAAAAASPSN